MMGKLDQHTKNTLKIQAETHFIKAKEIYIKVRATIIRSGIYTIKEFELLKQALHEVNLGLKIWKNHIYGINLKGCINLDLNNTKEAKKNFEEALTINPNLNNARYNLALCLILEEGKDKEKEALSLLAKNVREKPDDFVSLYMLAKIYFKKGEYDTSKNIYERLLKMHENYVPIYIIKEKCEEKEGNLKKALKTIEKAIKIFPNYKNDYSVLGYALEYVPNEPELNFKKKYYKENIENFPKLIELYFLKACILRKLGKEKRAEKTLEKIKDTLVFKKLEGNSQDSFVEDIKE